LAGLLHDLCTGVRRGRHGDDPILEIDQDEGGFLGIQM
jgi:hypothetical protein